MLQQPSKPLDAALSLRVIYDAGNFAADVCVLAERNTAKAGELFRTVFEPMTAGLVTDAKKYPTRDDLKRLVVAHARKALELLD